MKPSFLLVGLFVVVGLNAYGGGGGSGVHYLCGSGTLKVSLQLDNRPDRRHFPKGTKVLVHEPIFHTSFFNVTYFMEGSQTTTLALKSPDTSQPRSLTLIWLGDSIVDNIRMIYVWGMHKDSADDGKCTVLN